MGGRRDRQSRGDDGITGHRRQDAIPTPTCRTGRAIGDAARRWPVLRRARGQPLVPPRWVPRPHLRARAVRRLDARSAWSPRRAAATTTRRSHSSAHARDADDGSRMTDQQLREVMTLFPRRDDGGGADLDRHLLAQHPEGGRGWRGARAVTAARGERSARAALCRHGDHRVPAALPRRGWMSRQASGRPRAGGQPLAQRGVHRADVGGASRPALVRRAGSVPARALGGRSRAPAAAVRLLPVRGWPAPVHRQLVRPDGGGAGPRRDRPALPPRARARPAGSAGAVGHAAAGLARPDALERR